MVFYAAYQTDMEITVTAFLVYTVCLILQSVFRCINQSLLRGHSAGKSVLLC
ncbi:hypothetical protein LLB_2050 [Legionella longbeachae D-4968]|nr:hypothetical protein LLB_2050 [Legionella longbeachae D-4968]